MINPAVFAVVQTARAGTPLLSAWEDAGKPCSRSNIYKAFNAVDARTLQPKPRASHASEPLLPVPSSKPAKLPFKLTSTQKEQVQNQKADHWDAYVAAHRKATVEYYNSKATSRH